MRACFADAFYYLALINPADEAHARAKTLTPALHRPIVTTEYVLNEVADGRCAVSTRTRFLELYTVQTHNPNLVVVAGSSELFRAGIALYAQRSDEDWSLTDCISFVVREQRGIREALTGDRHFEQAGFVALLK